VSFGEVALWFFGLCLLIGLLGHLKHLIGETLESIVVQGLVLFLGVENAVPIPENIKFTQARPVLHVATWPRHIVYGTIHLPLYVVALG
jgi:hypothetical protein